MTKQTYLESLYRKHRALDDEIKILYTKFADDQLINRLKTQKLWLKDEIHRLENETGLSKRHS
mgnify:FL=1|tara:strand:+ start:2062 stop:2250 length:189 start_codon:yes stop_codon:yes gene_type:complete